MKAIFGVLSLVIVLAIVAMIAKTQLAQVARVAPASGNSRPVAPSVAPAGALGEQVRASAVQALQQGMERNQRADP